MSEWLEPHFEEHPELVVKDPRLSWFLGLWKAATLRCRIDTGHVVMLRAPGESIGIKGGKAGGQTNQTARAAGWLNQMLHAVADPGIDVRLAQRAHQRADRRRSAR